MGKAGPKYYGVVTVKDRESNIYYGEWRDIEHHINGVHCKHKSHKRREVVERFIAETLARFASQDALKVTALSAVIKTSLGELTSDLQEDMPGSIATLDQDVEVKLEHSNTDSVLPQPAEDPENVTPSIPLSEEQLMILDRVKRGHNVFITGPGGSGKSALLRAIIGLPSHNNRTLAITATTGVASVAFPGGRTFHAWAAMGQGTKKASELVKDIMANKTTRKRLQKTTRLVIDEVSMLDGSLFDKVEFIMRQVKGNNKPFGGIQLVVSGDFCQLPPVPGPSKVKPKFAFEARTWRLCFDTTYNLTLVFRQIDMSFVNMLSEIRIGNISAKTAAMLKFLERPVKYNDGIGPTELLPTKAEAAAANQIQLDRIDNPPMVFLGHETRGVDQNDHPIQDEQAEDILNRLSAPKSLMVKKKAQVMLLKNKAPGLVNGSTGVVAGFRTIEEAIRYRIAPFNVDYGDHKALERVKKSLPDVCRDPDSPSGWTDVKYPVVRFTGGLTLFCHPELFMQENRFGRLMAGRTQVPLIPAWALSIHKSQGATLQRVKVDLERVFERGQAYVALSRATSMHTLQVLNFDASKVKAHPYVLRWMGHEVDPRALEEEDLQRARAEEAYRRTLEYVEEEDYLQYAIEIQDD